MATPPVFSRIHVWNHDTRSRGRKRMREIVKADAQPMTLSARARGLMELRAHCRWVPRVLACLPIVDRLPPLIVAHVLAYALPNTLTVQGEAERSLLQPSKSRRVI